MVWPRPVPCPELCSVLDPVAIVTGSIEQMNLNKTYRNNLAAALARIDARAQKEGKNPCDYCVVVDLGGSKVQMGWRVAPCLTRSRGASHAFWNIQGGCFLSTRELCRLQALDIDDMNMANTAERHMGAMLGNGFTCTVIARVIAAGLQALENSVGLGQVGAYSEEDGSILGYDSHRGPLLKNGRASGSCGLASGGRGLGSGGRGLATGGHKFGTFGNSVRRKHMTKL